MNTRKITFGALIAAVAVAVLALGTLFPVLDLALPAIAGFLMTLVVLRCGNVTAWMCCAVTAVLSLLLPNRSCGLYFILLLGWYPIVKGMCERLQNRLWEWLAKLVAANAALAVTLLAFRALVTDRPLTLWLTAVVAVGYNVVFIVYDYGLTLWIARARRLLRLDEWE